MEVITLRPSVWRLLAQHACMLAAMLIGVVVCGVLSSVLFAEGRLLPGMLRFMEAALGLGVVVVAINLPLSYRRSTLIMDGNGISGPTRTVRGYIAKGDIDGVRRVGRLHLLNQVQIVSSVDKNPIVIVRLLYRDEAVEGFLALLEPDGTR